MIIALDFTMSFFNKRRIRLRKFSPLKNPLSERRIKASLSNFNLVNMSCNVFIFSICDFVLSKQLTKIRKKVEIKNLKSVKIGKG